jgi:hypothetical protein
MEKPSHKACADAAFHLDFDKARDRWDIVDHHGKVVGHSHNHDEALNLAIREAQHVHSLGDDVFVCVQQPDGHYAVAWSS